MPVRCLLSICFAPLLITLFAFQPIEVSAAERSASDNTVKKNTVKDADRPNIVLCMADDQGWGDVGYYGSSPVQTPVLDKMAATGLRFDRFYAAAPVCSPTRGSVLTGRHPNRFGCFSWGFPLRPQETTIAEALQEAGYLTAHFGKWHLGSVRPDSPVSPGNSGFDTWLSSPNFYENNPLMSFNGKVIQTQGESSQVPVDYAVDFMKDAQKKNKPFLAVIWFGSPHQPHIPTAELKALYPDETPQMQNILGELTGIDRAMGSLKNSLQDLGIAEKTILWYTSDNGALKKVGNTAGLSGRKGSLLEGGIRVPAIIEWPGTINEHRIIDNVCSTVDIFPTVLELAGVSIKKGQPILDGQSLVPIIESKNFQRKSPLGFWVFQKGGRGMKSQLLLEQQRDKSQLASDIEPDPALIAGNISVADSKGPSAWLDGDWKLHRIPGKNQAFSYRLYNLKSDPQEKKDLLANQPARAKRMKQQLANWQASVVNSLNGKDYK